MAFASEAIGAPCEKAPAYTIDKAKKMATTLDIT